MSRNTWTILILIIVGLGVVLLFAFLPEVPPEHPTTRAFRDMRSCERRVGIPPPTDPAYKDAREFRYGAYVACMVNLGYTSKDLP